MKKMHTLLKSFSLAALFSLAACGVEDPDQAGSIDKDDDTCLECRDPDADLERSPGFSQNERDAAIAGQTTPAKRAAPEVEVLRCVQDDDCESNVCDQEENVCRD